MSGAERRGGRPEALWPLFGPVTRLKGIGEKTAKAFEQAGLARPRDVLMTLPAEVRVLPGHTDETTIGREWEENPFVRYWRREAPPIDEAVRVAGEDATLLVWSPDYDGNGKALVRFAGGREAVVGGSRVER